MPTSPSSLSEISRVPLPRNYSGDVRLTVVIYYAFPALRQRLETLSQSVSLLLKINERLTNLLPTPRVSEKYEPYPRKIERIRYFSKEENIEAQKEREREIWYIHFAYRVFNVLNLQKRRDDATRSIDNNSSPTRFLRLTVVSRKTSVKDERFNER